MKKLVIILLFAHVCFHISCADEELTPRLPEYLFFVHGDSLSLQAEKVDRSDLVDRTFFMRTSGTTGKLTFYGNGNAAVTYWHCYRMDYSGKWKIEGDTVVATFTTAEDDFGKDTLVNFTKKYVVINQNLCEVKNDGRNLLMYLSEDREGPGE